MITIEDFQKIDIRVGKILSAEKVLDTDKLLKLSVDLGTKSAFDGSPEHSTEPNVLGEEREIRQIISGISTYFPDCSVLVGKKCMFVVNLEPRIIRGLESNGMLFAVSDEAGIFSLLEPSEGISVGARAK